MTDARRVLEQANTIAVVGCSTHAYKAAHRIPQQLQAAGYRIIPVHPWANRILGEPVYRSLLDMSEPVDLVDVFRPADEAPRVAKEAAEIGAPALWLQLGIRSDEARRIAEEAGMDYVEDRCTGADVHRFAITKTRNP